MKPSYLILFVFFSCSSNQNKSAVLNEQTITTNELKLNYDSCKNRIIILKQQYKKGWSALNKSIKENIFVNAVTATIIPNWMGTSWSFSGTSEIPLQGSIACGYFVTTVLRDAGLQLSRVKLAQCASEQMILALVQTKYISRFSNLPVKEFINRIKTQGYGIFIIGLDYHTGFIYNDGTEIYFIHASYRGTKTVIKEKASESAILAGSHYKVIGKLSADERVLERWGI